MNKHLTIEDFWDFHTFIQQAFGEKAEMCFDSCGLISLHPRANFRYDCTPINAVPFAQTGGNGVHFSLLNGKNEKGYSGPIVMTSPMADEYNIIVSEDFEEFFSLGYYNGWFALEEIAYNLRNAVQYYAIEDKEKDEVDRAFLKMLRDHIGFSHSPLRISRLEYLNATYFWKLEVLDFE
ncbi:MAG: hypothetical protein AAFY71_02730 [Bacteroidota bacterium]